jgi:hypothetical protein
MTPYASKVKAVDVQPGQFVRAPQFYGTVERIDRPIGSGTVVFHLQAGYTFTLSAASKVSVS